MTLNLAGGAVAVSALLLFVTIFFFHIATAEDPYKFFNWNVTYGDIYPLGVRQRGMLINGQFSGPDIHFVTNDNLIINVFNSLDDPFLLSWSGSQIIWIAPSGGRDRPVPNTREWAQATCLGAILFML